MFNHYDDILTVEQLMEILSIGRNKAYQLLASGEIKSFKIGRVHKIPRDSVTEFIIEKCKDTTSKTS